MRRDDCIIYIGHIISIGVPHFYDPTNVFWHTGQLLRVGEDALILKKSDGRIIEIPLIDVKILKLERYSSVGWG